MEPEITITAPEGYQPEAGKPISFNVPVKSLDMSKIMPTIDVRSLAPKEIAEKDYFKKITNTEDLFKTLDGAQTLLGTKPKYSIPAVDAPQEEWDAYNAANRAAKVDDYKFEADPNAPAELKASPEFQTQVKQMFYDAGINPRQASILQKKYDGLMMGLYKANQDKQAAIDKQFAEITKPLVGDKPEESFARSKQIMEYLLPKELHPYIGKANNEGLLLAMAMSQVVEKKYFKEDEIPKGKGSDGSGPDALRKQAMEKQTEAGKLDSMDPKRTTLMQEARELYKQWEAATK